MKRWAEIWGLVGVVVFLLSAVWRVMPDWTDITVAEGGPLSYGLLLILVPLMCYLEGHRGFYKGFAPRVLARSKALACLDRPVYRWLAPLYCMGFIGSSARRKLGLGFVCLAIFGLVVGVRNLPQPWRWEVDVSVALALVYGVGAVVWLYIKGAGVRGEPLSTVRAGLAPHDHSA